MLNFAFKSLKDITLNLINNMKKSLLLIVLVAVVSIISSCRPSRPACPAYTLVCAAAGLAK